MQNGAAADVVAKEPSPLLREASPETWQFCRTVTLDVLETWKGPALFELEVDYEQLVCPQAPQFEAGAPLLVYLVRVGDRLGVLGMASGVRYPLNAVHRWQLAEAVASALRYQSWLGAPPAAWSAQRRLLEEAPMDLGLNDGELALVPFVRRSVAQMGEPIREELRRQRFRRELR